MNNSNQEPSAQDQQTDARQSEGDWQEWVMLLADSALSFIRLLKAEATLAFTLLPNLLMMTMLRIPMLLLTWLSLGGLIGTAVYTWLDSAIAGVGAFFLMQLIATLLVESVVRKARYRCSLPETRKAASMVAASVQEHFGQRSYEEARANESRA